MIAEIKTVIPKHLLGSSGVVLDEGALAFSRNHCPFKYQIIRSIVTWPVTLDHTGGKLLISTDNKVHIQTYCMINLPSHFPADVDWYKNSHNDIVIIKNMANMNPPLSLQTIEPRHIKMGVAIELKIEWANYALSEKFELIVKQHGSANCKHIC